MLIDVHQLHRRLEDPEWIVFDCRHDLTDSDRGRKLYDEGHIPGAFFAPTDTALCGRPSGDNGRHPLPAPEDFAEFLESQGISSGTRLVAYDDAGGQFAARLWWMARWIGLQHAMVLDGGLTKWVAEGLPLSRGAPTARPRGVITARPDASIIASLEEVAEASARGNRLIIDARAAERFRGESEPIDPVAGHIPGARNHFFKENLNEDQTLRPPEELRRKFESVLSGRTPDEVIHQCGSGITACANLLAMEHAGLKGSRLYVGSWSEWCADPDRPVERGG